MYRSTLSIMMACLLTACATSYTKQPVCSGNHLKNCQPVVYFAENSDALTLEAKENLDWTSEKMKIYESKRVTATGYADTVGEPAQILSLAKKRAEAVKKYLVKTGIASDRVTVAVMPSLQAVCNNDSCKEVNRRVEVAITTPDGPASRESDWAPFHPNNWKCAFCDEE